MTPITLISVELSNFRKHRNLLVEFDPDGMTAITGPNYAGKTTVLQAVIFCLFGASAVAGTRDDLVTSGEKRMTVTLALRQGESVYTVRRTTTTAVVLCGEQTLASSSSEVQNWVVEALGVPDYRTALSLCYSQQTETAALLTLGVSTLNSLVEKLSGADEADSLIQTARDFVKRLQAEREGLGELPTDDLEATLCELQEEHEQAGRERQKASALRDSAREARDKAMDDMKRADQANREAAAHNKSLQLLRSDLHTAEQLLHEASERLNPEALQVDLDCLRDRADEASQKYDSAVELQSSVASAKALKARLAKRLQELEKEYDEAEIAEPERKILECSLVNLQAEKDEKVGCKSECEGILKGLKSGIKDAVCFNCHRPYEGVDIKELEAKLPKAEAELGKCLSALQVLNINIAAKTKALNALKSHRPAKAVQGEYTSVEVEYAEAEALAGQSVGDIAGLKTDYEVCRDAFLTAKAERAAAAKALKSREAAGQKADELRAELEGQEELPTTSMQDLIEEAERLGREYDKAELAAGERREAEVDLTGHIDDTLLLIDERAELEDKIGECERLLGRMAKFSKWLSQNKSAFLSSIWAGVMGLTSDFTRQTTSGAVVSVSRDPETGRFSFEEEDGHSRPIELASGGQKGIAGTGMRLALSELLPSALGFVILDEPSSELNDEHAAALAGALRSAGRQVIVVTHRQGEQFSSDRLIELG